MYSRFHGRVCLPMSFCLFILLYILITPSSTTVRLFGIKDFSAGQGIGNSSLGVSIPLSLSQTLTYVTKFEAIFVINAPWCTDRKDSLTLAAAYSGISLELVNLVNESHIDERAYPQGNHRILLKGSRGSWRAHMDMIRMSEILH
jgi:hypothetical protein